MQANNNFCSNFVQILFHQKLTRSQLKTLTLSGRNVLEITVLFIICWFSLRSVLPESGSIQFAAKFNT